MKKEMMIVFLTLICTLSIVACNKSDITMKDTTQEIAMQELTTADLVVDAESSVPEPEITMEEEIPSRKKQVADALKAHITVGDADFHFAENQYLAINGSLFEVPGLALFDEKMELYTFIYDLEFVDILDIKMVDITKPIILANHKYWGTDVYVTSERDRKKGVYIIEDREWKIKPIYSSIHVNDDGTYSAFANAETTVLDLQGNIILRPFELRLGDRIWQEYKPGGVSQPMSGAKIYDLSGHFLKEFSLEGDVEYAYRDGDFLKVKVSSEDMVLYDKDGELVFARQDIPKDVVAKLESESGFDGPVSIGSISDNGSLIEVKHNERGYNNAAMIFDLNNRILLTKPEDRAYLNQHDSEISYIVRNNKGSVVYHSDGTPAMSRTNTPYSMVAGNGCYAYQDGDFLMIDDTKSQETCRIRLEAEIEYAEQVLPGMYLLKMDAGEFYLYHGDQLIETSDEIHCKKVSDYGIITVGCYDYEGDGTRTVGSYVFDQNGNLLYQTKETSSYILVTDQLLVHHGNKYDYICVYDYSGNIALTLKQ